MKFSLLLLVMLAGCSTVGGTFDNIASCSLAKDKLLVSSMYGGSFGITAVIRKADTEAVCGSARPAP